MDIMELQDLAEMPLEVLAEHAGSGVLDAITERMFDPDAKGELTVSKFQSAL